MSLNRFHAAQESASAGYDTALSEIRAGAKRSHWIWYIFPQLGGLGRSPAAREFAIRDRAEASAYLRDPVLRQRYEEIGGAVREQLTAGRKLETLMGSSIDALKLVSSLTLFRAAAETLAAEDCTYGSVATLCSAILQRAADEGYAPCSHTIATLSR
jgi:uncharacterized protein (DUF1810 family)